jgi:hypothetical protein
LRDLRIVRLRHRLHLIFIFAGIVFAEDYGLPFTIESAKSLREYIEVASLSTATGKHAASSRPFVVKKEKGTWAFRQKIRHRCMFHFFFFDRRLVTHPSPCFHHTRLNNHALRKTR